MSTSCVLLGWVGLTGDHQRANSNSRPVVSVTIQKNKHTQPDRPNKPNHIIRVLRTLCSTKKCWHLCGVDVLELYFEVTLLSVSLLTIYATNILDLHQHHHNDQTNKQVCYFILYRNNSQLNSHPSCVRPPPPTHSTTRYRLAQLLDVVVLLPAPIRRNPPCYSALCVVWLINFNLTNCVYIFMCTMDA